MTLYSQICSLACIQERHGTDYALLLTDEIIWFVFKPTAGVCSPNLCLKLLSLRSREPQMWYFDKIYVKKLSTNLYWTSTVSPGILTVSPRNER